MERLDSRRRIDLGGIHLQRSPSGQAEQTPGQWSRHPAFRVGSQCFSDPYSHANPSTQSFSDAFTRPITHSGSITYTRPHRKPDSNAQPLSNTDSLDRYGTQRTNVGRILPKLVR